MDHCLTAITVAAGARRGPRIWPFHSSAAYFTPPARDRRHRQGLTPGAARQQVGRLGPSAVNAITAEACFAADGVIALTRSDG
jgi:hypothetical protein